MPLVNVFLPVVIAAVVPAPVHHAPAPAHVYDPQELLRTILSRPASPIREILMPEIVTVEAVPYVEPASADGE